MTGVRRLILFLISFIAYSAYAQTGNPTVIRTDSTTQTKNPAFTRDTSIKIVNKDTIKTASKHNPGTATLRSLILPGWGQAYNREYWKIPIVYAAIGTMAGFWIFNNMWYKRTRDAYDIRVNRPQDSLQINPKLQPLATTSLQFYRNSYRRDRDYSTLYFILTWGLNIVDATVFGHLKEFDVSEDLSLKINPVINKNAKGFSLVLGFKSPTHKVSLIP
ncbi:DUF5683 domain-containing protein [Segetibacter aerophilus]|uniref:DUF5683 domain-containing protein n=1 Tax=Segetibacter aerophilus TaxID=670293 RepID=A0A512B9E3_9BACT|nr:DUF5683 domain-containing protein [Segetibacter aerophilus]GEO08586.1 hypothetical protein SAE01_10820 [Segetibacter aerophilus]